MRWVWPLAVNSDCGLVAVRLVRDEIAGTDPEVWADHNEERLIPAGVTADDVVTEWAADGTWIHAATVTKAALAQTTRDLKGQRFLLRSLTVPLWDLGRMYAGLLREPFIMWKCTTEGSTFAFVSDGAVAGLCSHWAGREDVVEGYAELFEQVAALLGSLSGHTAQRVVVVPTGDGADDIPDQITIPGYRVSGPPDIPGVVAEWHEPFALAVHEPTTLEFAPFADTQEARALASRRRLALNTLRGAVAALALLFIGVGVLAGGAQLAQMMLAERVRPIQADMLRLRGYEHRLDTLRQELMHKAGSIRRESIVTYLLAEFQESFPEGAWAEQIVVSERDSQSWSVDILAMALSTADVPQLLQRTKSIPGMQDVRLLYSEQTTVGGGKARRGVREKRAIRVKLEGAWEADRL